MLAAAVALNLTGFVSHAPNRIVPGAALPLAAVADRAAMALLALDGLALAALALAKPRPAVRIAVAGLLGATVLGLLLLAGHGAEMLSLGKPPGARTSLGTGFWLSMAALALAAIDLAQQSRLGPRGKATTVVLCLAAVIGVAATGRFDHLSLLREYRAHADTFQAELIRHVMLVVVSVSLATAIALPAGVLAAQRPVVGRRLLEVLSLVQTIPSIALFGLLIGPLSSLAAALPSLKAVGVSGIGAAPAIIALVLYGLLPLVRNTATGLEGVPPAVIDAAAGNGMRPHQILMKVRLPLALPVILSGLRVVVTQTIGLTVVAALIGAGGLGSFVFLGLGQNAVDLIMLGVIPTVVLALLAESLLSIVIASIGPAA